MIHLIFQQIFTELRMKIIKKCYIYNKTHKAKD